MRNIRKMFVKKAGKLHQTEKKSNYKQQWKTQLEYPFTKREAKKSRISHFNILCLFSIEVQMTLTVNAVNS